MRCFDLRNLVPRPDCPDNNVSSLQQRRDAMLCYESIGASDNHSGRRLRRARDSGWHVGDCQLCLGALLRGSRIVTRYVVL